jgi:hypothetical protein
LRQKRVEVHLLDWGQRVPYTARSVPATTAYERD